MIVGIVIMYILCCVVSYGGTLGYFQNEDPELADEDYEDDQMGAVLFSIGGPISLIVCAVGSGFFKHGFKFK